MIDFFLGGLIGVFLAVLVLAYPVWSLTGLLIRSIEILHDRIDILGDVIGMVIGHPLTYNNKIPGSESEGSPVSPAGLEKTSHQ